MSEFDSQPSQYEIELQPTDYVRILSNVIINDHGEEHEYLKNTLSATWTDHETGHIVELKCTPKDDGTEVFRLTTYDTTLNDIRDTFTYSSADFVVYCEDSEGEIDKEFSQVIDSVGIVRGLLMCAPIDVQEAIQDDKAENEFARLCATYMISGDSAENGIRSIMRKAGKHREAELRKFSRTLSRRTLGPEAIPYGVPEEMIERAIDGFIRSGYYRTKYEPSKTDN